MVITKRRFKKAYFLEPPVAVALFHNYTIQHFNIVDLMKGNRPIVDLNHKPAHKQTFQSTYPMLPGLDVDDAHAVLLKHPDQGNDYQKIIIIQGRYWVRGGRR